MKILGTLLSVVLMGAVVVGGYWGVKFVVDFFGVLELQAVAITTIAAVTILLCAGMIHRGFVQIGRKETTAQMRLEKANLYERMLLIWGMKLKNKTTPVDQPVEAELQQLVQLLALRGSPKVIQAYVELHTLEKTVGLSSPDIPSRFVTLQMEMRKDLGLSMRALQAEDLLQLCFADVQVAPAPSKAQPLQDLQPRVSLAANA